MQASLLDGTPGIPWGAEQRQWTIQVFGAGGALGRELVRDLLEAGHPASRLTLVGRRAASLTWREQRLAVLPMASTVQSSDLAFLCTPPEVSCRIRPRLAARGTRVVDLTGGRRAGPQPFPVLAELNGDRLGAFTEELCLPLPSCALIAPPLALLERAAGLAEVDLFAVIGNALHGARGMLALRDELRQRAGAAGAPATEPEARVGNLLPAEAVFPGFGSSLSAELARLLEAPDLLLDVTALAGDVERCDLFAARVQLHAPLSPEEAVEVLGACATIEVRTGERAPTAAECTGGGRIHVGQIRPGSRGPRSLCFCAAGDQLRAGSSCAALRVAARLPLGG